jgi:nicotinate-nucleotide adenylyltransferase
MGKRIGLLGGTFDPVHIGHLRSALEVADTLGLQELRLIPNARPPHRDTPQVSAQERLAMVQCAVAGIAPLVVDDRELKSQRKNEIYKGCI